MLPSQPYQQLAILMALEAGVVATDRGKGRAAHGNRRIGDRHAMAKQELAQSARTRCRIRQPVQTPSSIPNIAEAVNGAGDVRIGIEEAYQPPHASRAEGVVGIEKGNERRAGQRGTLDASLVGAGRYRQAAPCQAGIIK